MDISEDPYHPHAEPEPPAGSLVGDVLRNPVVQTLLVMVVVTTATWLAMFVRASALFVLAPPFSVAPWTLVTSIYAHASLGHFLANAIMIVLAGSLVAMSTTWLRFHAFFLVTGVAAGVVQVAVFVYMGYPIALLGASGAAFALVGYVLTSNAISATLTSWLRIPFSIVLAGSVFVAAALTVQYSAPGSALLAHFTGALLGLLAGYVRLLHV